MGRCQKARRKKMRPLIYTGNLGTKLCWRELIVVEDVRHAINDKVLETRADLARNFRAELL